MQTKQHNTDEHMGKAKLTMQEQRNYTNTPKPQTIKPKSTNYKQKTSTWARINNKIKRQIDYIMINRRIRNCVKTTQTITGWKANMHQTQQQNVLYMRLCVKLVKTTEKAHPETGANITYNIQGLKLNHEAYKNIWSSNKKLHIQHTKQPQQNWKEKENKYKTHSYKHIHTGPKHKKKRQRLDNKTTMEPISRNTSSGILHPQKKSTPNKTRATNEKNKNNWGNYATKILQT